MGPTDYKRNGFATNGSNALQNKGFDIQHICRTDREGFKAGALKEGLKIAKGEFIAIFDADFLPKPDWLKRTIPFFKDGEIGVVQTRWGHINRDYSVLTKVQAFALDAHFTLEQVGRSSKGHFINFNGTAGVWRKDCILDAGNWEGDTLTEDLDLSYRAQLRDWKFKYLEDVETPAELPVVISAARSQQFRWNKGGAENFQKMFKRVVKIEKQRRMKQKETKQKNKHKLERAKIKATNSEKISCHKCNYKCQRAQLNAHIGSKRCLKLQRKLLATI